MSRLSAIIDAATGDSVSVASLLRMVQVLAARTKTATLVDWVDNELKGYGDGAALPDYRGPFTVQVLSEWSGPFQSIIRNLPLPPSSVPKELRDVGAFAVEFRESVSELERLAQSTSPLSYAWGADVAATLNGLIHRGKLNPIVPMHGLVSAHRVVSPAAIQATLDNVRTRVLGVALEIERILPDAGEPGVLAEDPSSIQYVVTNHIYGSAAVAIGSDANQLIATVHKGDRDSLLQAAAAAGLTDEDTSELASAIDADGDKPGGRVTAFLGKLAIGARKGTGQTLTGAAGSIIADLVSAYYGY